MQMLPVAFCNNHHSDHVSGDMEVAEERSPAMSDSSEGEVIIIHHCNEDYLNHLDHLGDMISMILVKTMRMILNINDCQGGGRGPGRFGRKKFSQHSLRSCWQEFPWTRQVKIVLIVMTMMLMTMRNIIMINTALAWHEWSKGEAQATPTSRTR